MIVKHLRQIQEQFGYLPVEELRTLSERIGEPLHRLNEVISFFPSFRMAPPPPVEVKVCRDMACHLRGAGGCFQAIESVAREFGVASLTVGDDEAELIASNVESQAARLRPRVTVEWVSCLGRCDQAPAVLVELHRPGQPDQFRVLGSPQTTDHVGRLREIVAPHLIGDSPPEDVVDLSPLPWKIDPYSRATFDISQDDLFQPYLAIRRLASDWLAAPNEAGRKAVGDRLLDALNVSGLRGMGGAGVPVARKWGDVRATPGDEKYVICNADESEPTTFKDRELLSRAPHLIVEGMAIAALLTGAERGYVYIRHEYHDQIHAMERAIDLARDLGIIGSDILGTRRPFELEVFESPGGYVCGEQSALIEAIEQRRAEPRNKPPQLETNGLYDKPTIVNNVESFAWVPAIVLRGGEWYANQGQGARGLRLFSLCGDVEHPGVYEVPIGAPLRTLIGLAGGLKGGRILKAVAPSGPSGGLIPARIGRQDVPEELHRNLPPDGSELDILDLPLDLDKFRTLGLMLGGGIMVVAEPDEGATDVPGPLSLAVNATRFFRNESCGKCVPCRIGSQKLVEIGESVEKAQAIGDVQALARYNAMVVELRRAMELTSICGLGVVAAYPLATTLQSFWKDLRLERPIAEI